jgi:hypothetical protein
MAGFADIPQAQLIEFANANRVNAMGIEFLQPEVGLLFKVGYQRGGAGGVFRIPSTFAIMFAEPIAEAATKNHWAAAPPTALAITDSERLRLPEMPDGGVVLSGHVMVMDAAVILVLGFGNSLGLCLRVGRNHAAWFAGQVLDARNRGLLSDVRSAERPRGGLH